MVTGTAGRICTAGVNGSSNFTLHCPGGGGWCSEAAGGVHRDRLSTQVQRRGPGTFPHLFRKAWLESGSRDRTRSSGAAITDKDRSRVVHGSGFRWPLLSWNYSLNLLKNRNIMSLFSMLPSVDSKHYDICNSQEEAIGVAA